MAVANAAAVDKGVVVVVVVDGKVVDTCSVADAASAGSVALLVDGRQLADCIDFCGDGGDDDDVFYCLERINKNYKWCSSPGGGGGPPLSP